MGTFKETSRHQLYWDDPEIDSIYDRIAELRIDVEVKLEELDKLLAEESDKLDVVRKELIKLEDAYDIAEQATREDVDDEEAEAAYKKASEALDECEERYHEQYLKVDALQDAFDYLDNLHDSFED